MITFRFYLVSLVAVFLAIAVGVVIGSSFVEPRLVESLRAQVESVQGNLDGRLEVIDDLKVEVQDLEAYVDQSAPFSVDATLVGSEVLVVAEQGLDAESVERLVGRLRQAGASTEGIIWLDGAWQESDERLPELAGLLEILVEPDMDIASASWSAVLVGLGVDAATDGGPGNTVPPTTLPETVPTTVTTLAVDPDVALLDREVLATLEAAGFLDLQRIEEGEPVVEPSNPVSGPPLAVVFVTGPGSDHDDGGALVTSLARQQAAAGVPTVVAESYAAGDDAAERGSWVAQIRGDGELSSIVATIDDLDLIQGRVAAVLAVADLAQGVVGHYGYGSGADRVLPEYLGRSGP